MKAPVRKVRCAIYTRVSTDERLDMEFNSLDAQREAALAYIAEPEARGLDPRRRPLRRRRLLRRHAWSGRRCSGCCAMSRAASST